MIASIIVSRFMFWTCVSNPFPVLDMTSTLRSESTGLPLLVHIVITIIAGVITSSLCDGLAGDINMIMADAVSSALPFPVQS